MPPNGRASANGRVVMLHFTGARGGDQLRQRLAADSGKREVNDIGIAKQIVKKGLNRLQRVGSAKLKENYPHTPFCARHFPQNPQNERTVLPIERASQWRKCKTCARFTEAADVAKPYGSPCELSSLYQNCPGHRGLHHRALEAERIVGQPCSAFVVGQAPFCSDRSDAPLAGSRRPRRRHIFRRIGKRIAIGRRRRSLLDTALMIAGGCTGVAAQKWPAVIWRLSIFRSVHCSDRGRQQAPASLHCQRARPSFMPSTLADSRVRRRSRFLSARSRLKPYPQRALTDPRLLSGIGNAYSDEILHAAQLSPIALTKKLPSEWETLCRAHAGKRLQTWIVAAATGSPSFPRR